MEELDVESKKPKSLVNFKDYMAKEESKEENK